MKYFERDSKYNFVDANNVFVGYDSHQDCCELASWYLSFKPGVFPLIDSDNSINADELDAYSFDTSYFREDSADETAIAEFKLVAAGLPDIYLILHNTHNGYYGHGFKCEISGTVLRSGIL